MISRNCERERGSFRRGPAASDNDAREICRNGGRRQLGTARLRLAGTRKRLSSEWDGRGNSAFSERVDFKFAWGGRDCGIRGEFGISLGVLGV